jgi:hypothetical protein
MKTIIVIALVAILGWQGKAQTYDTNGAVVQTFAGSGFSGYVDGAGQLTMFNNPRTIVADSFGNLYVEDAGNGVIRKIAPDATVTTFAGGGNAWAGFGTNANLGGLYDSWMAIDHSNALWYAYANGGVFLMRVGSDGYASRRGTNLTGMTVKCGICFDSANNLYYSGNNKIYRLFTNGTLEVFVGSGNGGWSDGNGIFTSFSSPSALACDSADNIYVWDTYNYVIRRINQNRDVVTIAGQIGTWGNSDGLGTNAIFSPYNSSPVSAITVDNLGNLYLACGTSVRKIDARTNAVTVAGNFSQTGYANGAGNVAQFNPASGICVSGGTIFVADTTNQRIRSITNNPTAQVISPTNLKLGTYPGLQITGIVGRSYQIQASSDMNSWSLKATILLTSSPYLWIDQNSVSGNKFYRALMLP